MNEERMHMKRQIDEAEQLMLLLYCSLFKGNPCGMRGATLGAGQAGIPVSIVALGRLQPWFDQH